LHGSLLHSIPEHDDFCSHTFYKVVYQHAKRGSGSLVITLL